jgi:hypothetical protein
MNVYVIILDIDIESKEVEAVVSGKKNPEEHIAEFKKWFWPNRKAACKGDTDVKLSKAEAFANWLVANKGYKKLSFSKVSIDA